MAKEMSPLTARKIAWASVAVLFGMFVMLCPCTFSPGWANEWPGISKHDAFAGTLTAMLLLAHLALAGLLAPLCVRLQGLKRYGHGGWRWFARVMAVALVVGLFDCALVFPVLRATIANEWP